LLWDGDIPWVSSGEVAFNRIKATRETIAPSAVSGGKRLHPPGTVMLAMIGEGKTRGQTAILDIEAAHNQNCASIRVSETRILPEYVFAFFKERYLETRRGSSGGQPTRPEQRQDSGDTDSCSSPRNAATHRRGTGSICDVWLVPAEVLQEEP
jgi:hypothetical protein